MADIFTPLQACTGIMAIGRPGAGKTTILRKIAAQLRANGCYLMICCVKPDEADAYKEILPDAFVFKPGSAVFNPIEYELSRAGGSVRNLSQFLDDLNEVLTRADGERTEPFWKNITADTLRFAIEACVMAGKPTFADVHKFILTSPVDLAAAASDQWKQSFCAQVINKCLNIDKEAALPIKDFFMNQLPSVGEKARGGAVVGALGGITPFTSGAIAKAVNGKSTITPPEMLNRHVILDFDFLTHRQNGLAFQLLCSWFCMEEVLRRRGKFPYFVLVRDEYQFFAYAKRDVPTQSVGRSQRFIGISAFQSIPVLESSLGGTMEARTDTEALYSLHVNKVMCNNNCHKTNEMNAEIIGKERQMFFGGGLQHSKQEPEWWDILCVGQAPSISFSQQFHYRVPPATFQSLSTGGAECNYQVGAIIHRGDRFEHVIVSQRESCNRPTILNLLRRK